MTAGEPVGNRVARARALFEQLEYEQALALLRPIRAVNDIPAAIGVDAALLETSVLEAMHNSGEATEACKVAVRRAGYDPEVAREQAPRVQADCREAAVQARREWVASRHIRFDASAVRTASVAWNAVNVTSRIGGDLDGLTTQAEVVIDGASPITISLPGTGAERVAALDASLAHPGARIEVTPLVRDSHGVLTRADAPSLLVVPRDEAAVRFAAGTDRGPLTIDGRNSGERVSPDLTIPLATGPHTLEVVANGARARTSITLHRGEVSVVSMHAVRSSSLPDVIRWGSTVGAVALLGAGGILQLLSASGQQQLERTSMVRDPNSGIPLVEWSSVQGIEDGRQQTQNIAYGLFAGGGALAIVAVVFWALPRGPAEEQPTRRSAVRVMPAGNGLAVTF